MEETSEKLFYSISEVAEMFQVNPSLIRFWEKEFDLIKPQKNKKGNRLFTKKDIDSFRKIFHLVKEKGFTLQGAKEELKSKNKPSINPASKNQELIEKLQKLRAELLKIKDSIK